MRPITTTSTGTYCDSSCKPSCSCIAMIEIESQMPSGGVIFSDGVAIATIGIAPERANLAFRNCHDQTPRNG